MRRGILLFLLVVIVLLFPINVYASNYEEEWGFKDENIVTVLNSQMDTKEYAKINDKSSYNDSLNNFSLNDRPAIKIYNELYWEYAGSSITDIVSHAELVSHIFDYEVFDDENIRLRSFERNGNVSIGISSVPPSLNYVNDIKETYSTPKILNQRCTINQIFCFDGFTSHMGAAVYYCTDRGIYVKYYADEYTPGVWFSEQDYQKYAVDYYNYLISPENNYDENGNALGGGQMPFLTYIDSINNKKYVEDDKTGNIEKIAIVILVTVAFISCAILIVSKMKKRTQIS
ncbi:MAG: hypothetical protein E7605_09050 [Ruminococcaceae bacterium]|nr:hypothetical protein [Oscillospiraceae bacterium]